MEQDERKILGYDINALSVDGCAEELFQTLQVSKSTWLACFNPHSYARIIRDTS